MNCTAHPHTDAAHYYARMTPVWREQDAFEADVEAEIDAMLASPVDLAEIVFPDLGLTSPLLNAIAPQSISIWVSACVESGLVSDSALNVLRQLLRTSAAKRINDRRQRDEQDVFGDDK